MAISKPHNSIDTEPTLIGKTITLRPLLQEDFAGLYEAASDRLIWEQHPDSLRYQREVFQRNFFSSAITNGALAVVENASNRIIGSSRYYQWNPENKEIAIGYTFLTRKYWGTGTNFEMKQLMLTHAFKSARTVWFHIGKNNLRSCRAVEKLGATYSHEVESIANEKPFLQCHYKLTAPYKG